LLDAFGQKFGRDPVAVAGVPNLFAQEVDAAANVEELATVDDGADADGMGGFTSIMFELTTAIPGIDEAMSFAELMKQVTHMDFSVIVFDNGPTGHPLRLVSFPTTLERAFFKMMGVKSRFGGLFFQFGGMMGGDMPDEDMLLGRLEETREVIEKVNTQFKDPGGTTFVCVCIPGTLARDGGSEDFCENCSHTPPAPPPPRVVGTVRRVPLALRNRATGAGALQI